MIWLVFVLAVLLVLGALNALSDELISMPFYVGLDADLSFWVLSFIGLCLVILCQITWRKFKISVGWLKAVYLGVSGIGFLAGLGVLLIHTLIIYQDFYQKIPKESYVVTAQVKVAEISDSIYDTKVQSTYRQKATISQIKLVDNTHQYAQNATDGDNPFYVINSQKTNQTIQFPEELTVLLTASTNQNSQKKTTNFDKLNALVPNTQTTMTLVISPLSKEISAAGFDGYRWLATRHIHANAKILSIDDSVSSANLSGLNVYLQNLRQILRDDFYQDWWQIPENKRQAKAVTLSLLTGDRALIDKPTKDLYQLSGISHLLAISGTHVVFLAICLAFLIIAFINACFYKLYLLFSKSTIRLFVMIMASFMYAMFTGFDVPAVRTVYMLIAMMIARSFAMSASSHQILAAVALMMIWCDPLVVWQAGFWLSFVAVLLLMRYEDKSLSTATVEQTSPSVNDSINIKQKIAQLLKLQSWLFITMLPVSVFLFGKVSLWGLVVNLFAVGLFGMIIVPINLLAGVIYVIFPALARLLWGISTGILEGFHHVILSLTSINSNVWIYDNLGILAIAFGGLMVLVFVVPIFTRRMAWIPFSALIMMMFYQPQKISDFQIQTIASDKDGISQLLLRQKNADPSSVNHQANWLILADFSQKTSKYQTQDLIDNLKKRHITHLTGVIVQTPSSYFIEAVHEINQVIPIHRYWQAGNHQKQNSLVMQNCQNGQSWQGDGLEVLAITGWKEINDEAVWGCSLKIVSDKKPTIIDTLTLGEDLAQKQIYQIIINGATDQKNWQLFDKICPPNDNKNAIYETDVWVNHSKSSMITEIFAKADPKTIIFTDKKTTQNQQKAEQIIAEIMP